MIIILRCVFFFLLFSFCVKSELGAIAGSPWRSHGGGWQALPAIVTVSNNSPPKHPLHSIQLGLSVCGNQK